MKKNRPLICLIFLFVSANLFSATVTFSGKAFLYRSTNNDGITVTIYSAEGKKVIVTTTTNALGFYKVEATIPETTMGLYAALITYKKDGYDSTAQTKLGQSNISSVTLDNVYLVKTGETAAKSEICLVTKDSQSKNNLVVWEKSSATNIKGYIIWKRNNESMLYDSLDYVTNTFVYEDVKSSKELSEVYKLQTVFTDNTLNLPSNPQKSLQIMLNKGSFENKTVLNIDLEELNLADATIFNDLKIDSIYVYRGTTPENLKIVQRFSGIILKNIISESNQKITSDTITASEALSFIYRVGFLLSTPCHGNSLKSDSGPFSQSLSNMAEASMVNEAENSAKRFKVISSSATGLQIDATEDAVVEIVSESGSILYNGKIVSGLQSIELNLPVGIYFAKIYTKTQVQSTSFVRK